MNKLLSIIAQRVKLSLHHQVYQCSCQSFHWRQKFCTIGLFFVQLSPSSSSTVASSIKDIDSSAFEICSLSETAGKLGVFGLLPTCSFDGALRWIVTTQVLGHHSQTLEPLLRSWTPLPLRFYTLPCEVVAMLPLSQFSGLTRAVVVASCFGI